MASKESKKTVAEHVKRLLKRKRPLSYEQIAERVREEVPGARTSARSVASMAASLRAAGADLPDRRRSH